jgi:hypothetical protein
MNETDEWGKDPSVQRMRVVFSHMEEGYRKLLKEMGISFYDERLPRARDAARALFEKAWSLGQSRGMDLDDDAIAGLYMHLLAWALGSAGAKVSPGALPDDERLKALCREVMP